MPKFSVQTAANRLALAIAIGAIAVSSAANAGTSATEVAVSQPPILGACDLNTIHISPNGEWVVLSRLEPTFGEVRDFTTPDGFVVYSIEGDLEAEVKHRSIRPFVFSNTRKVNPLRLIPIGWDGETLLFRVGPGILARGKIEPATKQWEIDEQVLAKEWRRFALRSVGQVDVTALYSESFKQTAHHLLQNDNLRRRTVYLHANGAKFSALDLAHHHQLKLGQTYHSMRSLGPSSFFNHFNLFVKAGEIEHDYLGRVFPSDESSAKNRFARPLIDQANGVAIGRYTPTGWTGLDLGNALSKLLGRESLLISHAAAAGDEVAVLAENDREMRLLVFDISNPSRISQIGVCDKIANMKATFKAMGATIPEEPLGAEPPGPQPVFGIELQAGADTTGVFYAAHKDPGDKLIVYFQGGPISSLYNRSLPAPLQRLRGSGFDVLAVEYAGGVGAGLQLSRALAGKPHFGFGSDAAAISSWIEANAYQSVSIYASSFGTAPAMIFREHNRGLIARSVFVAPPLDLPPPEIMEMSSGPLIQSEAGTQLQFEIGVFGSRERRNEFAEWLRLAASSYDASEDDLFIFGEMDTKASLESAPQNITDHAQILIVPRMGHGFLGAEKSTQNRIIDHLSER